MHLALCVMHALSGVGCKPVIVTLTVRLLPSPTGVSCGHPSPTSAHLWRTPTTPAARCRTVTPRSPPLSPESPSHPSRRQPGNHLWLLMAPPWLRPRCQLPYLPKVCSCSSYRGLGRGFGQQLWMRGGNRDSSVVECHTHDWQVSGSSPGRSGRRIFFYGSTFCADSCFGICSTPMLLQ